ncbi:MAG: hypothetical protein A6F71_09930 [Cycloclasticus sp. symbiont of Poecilosclerida sp. M]|nr:MAG: hypothetical protein A6F71_09930 [Cycloclasticus sp. symbiont of Poecilosclerida sp. M]
MLTNISGSRGSDSMRLERLGGLAGTEAELLLLMVAMLTAAGAKPSAVSCWILKLSHHQLQDLRSSAVSCWILAKPLSLDTVDTNSSQKPRQSP